MEKEREVLGINNRLECCSKTFIRKLRARRIKIPSKYNPSKTVSSKDSDNRTWIEMARCNVDICKFTKEVPDRNSLHRATYVKNRYPWKSLEDFISFEVWLWKEIKHVVKIFGFKAYNTWAPPSSSMWTTWKPTGCGESKTQKIVKSRDAKFIEEVLQKEIKAKKRR